CDPEQMHDVVASFHKAVAEVMEQFDGFVAQYLSDGVLVYFGYPVTREHDAEQAIRAALVLLDTVGALKAASNVGVQGRAGIATARVVVSEQSGADDTRRYVATGETPILAMRLQAIASPSEIVIADSTRRLVGRMFDCRPLGADETRSLTPLMNAWRVRG